MITIVGWLLVGWWFISFLMYFKEMLVGSEWRFSTSDDYAIGDLRNMLGFFCLLSCTIGYYYLGPWKIIIFTIWFYGIIILFFSILFLILGYYHVNIKTNNELIIGEDDDF